VKMTLKQADADWLKSGARWLADASRVKTKSCKDKKIVSVGSTHAKQLAFITSVGVYPTLTIFYL